jgi:hypothetical protein
VYSGGNTSEPGKQPISIMKGEKYEDEFPRPTSIQTIGAFHISQSEYSSLELARAFPSEPSKVLAP